MRPRTIRRFRKRAILTHWLHTASFIALLTTGSMMFLHLTGPAGDQAVKVIHRIAAACFMMIPVLYSIIDSGTALSFLKEAFLWDRDDLGWEKSAVNYYFGGKVHLPPQDRINAGQKIWQLLVVLAGLMLTFTGVILWFFRLKIPVAAYQEVLLAHATTFILITAWFLWHAYLATLHPRFPESLPSMLDGNVSEGYAAEHYRKWYDRISSGNDLEIPLEDGPRR